MTTQNIQEKSINSTVSEILRSYTVKDKGTQDLPESYTWHDEKTLNVKDLGNFTLTPDLQRAKLTQLLHNEIKLKTNSQKREYFEALQNGFLGVGHMKNMKNQGKIIDEKVFIDDADTMSAAEYKEKNLKLLYTDIENQVTRYYELCKLLQVQPIIIDVDIKTKNEFKKGFEVIYKAKKEKEQKYKKIITSLEKLDGFLSYHIGKDEIVIKTTGNISSTSVFISTIHTLGYYMDGYTKVYDENTDLTTKTVIIKENNSDSDLDTINV